MNYLPEPQYECYPWSEEGYGNDPPGPSVGLSLVIEIITKWQPACEGHGYVFTKGKGNDKLAPGCGTCWCCKPKGGKLSLIN